MPPIGSGLVVAAMLMPVSTALITDTENTALQTLKSACGSGWPASIAWDAAQSCSEWSGVGCDATGNHVTNIDIRVTADQLTCDTNAWDGLDLSPLRYLLSVSMVEQNLSGPLPRSFATLRSLGALHLDGNQLTGSLQELTQYRDLHSVSLANNALTGGIPQNLPDLTRLILSSNSLTGPIPESLLSTGNLVYVDLSQNSLSGNITTSHINPYLKSFNVGHNGLTGHLPEIGADLVSELRLANNAFTGPIPLSYLGLGSLEVLLVEQNQLSGFIPALSAALVQADFSGNDFSCPLPSTASAYDTVDCSCQAGFRGDEHTCQKCEVGTFADVAHTSPNWATSCTPCEAGLVARASGSTSCVAPATTTARVAQDDDAEDDAGLAASQIALMIGVVTATVVLLVVAATAVGCLQRGSDDQKSRALMMIIFEKEMEVEVTKGRLTKSQAGLAVAKLVKQYDMANRTGRCCWRMKNGKMVGNVKAEVKHFKSNAPRRNQVMALPGLVEDEEQAVVEIINHQPSQEKWSIMRQRSKSLKVIGDWEKLYDEEYDHEYYYNQQTGESCWERPPEFVE